VIGAIFLGAIFSFNRATGRGLNSGPVRVGHGQAVTEAAAQKQTLPAHARHGPQYGANSPGHFRPQQRGPFRPQRPQNGRNQPNAKRKTPNQTPKTTSEKVTPDTRGLTAPLEVPFFWVQHTSDILLVPLMIYFSVKACCQEVPGKSASRRAVANNGNLNQKGSSKPNSTLRKRGGKKADTASSNETSPTLLEDEQDGGEQDFSEMKTFCHHDFILSCIPAKGHRSTFSRMLSEYINPLSYHLYWVVYPAFTLWHALYFLICGPVINNLFGVNLNYMHSPPRNLVKHGENYRLVAFSIITACLVAGRVISSLQIWTITKLVHTFSSSGPKHR